jgi:hypothetical protein
MSEENCSESDVLVSAISNFIPEKSKHQSYMETLICIKY